MIDLGLNKNAVRMLTGLIMGTIVLLCIMWGDLALLILLAVMIIAGSKEYVKMLNHKGFYPSLRVIYGTEIILATVVSFNRVDLVAITLTICAMGSFMWVLFRGRQPYIANVATTLLGMVYCGWFPLHLIFLRDLSCTKYDSGLGFVILMFTSILLTDVGCYYVGTKLGKTKLAPVISPNKTIEGSLGGAFFAILGAMIIGLYLGLHWYVALAAGLICTIFAHIFYATLYGGAKSKISDFDVTNCHPTLRTSLYKMWAANLAAELVLKTKGAGDDKGSYRLLSAYLDGIDASDENNARLGTIRFLWRYLGLLGVCPEVHYCVQCGKNLFSASSPSQASTAHVLDTSPANVMYFTTLNGFVCGDCLQSFDDAGKKNGFVVSQDALTYLAAINDLSPGQVRSLSISASAAYEMKRLVFTLIENAACCKLKSLESGLGIL